MSEQPAHPREDHISLWRRFRLFFNVIVVVAILIAVKATIHALNFEFFELTPLFPSIVAGGIFIIGFLLSSILVDYKEAERMPSDLRMAMEAIHDDIFYFSERTANVDIAGVRKTLTTMVTALEEGLSRKGGFSHVEAAVAEVDRLSPAFADLERLGMSQNFLVRLRGQQDILRRCLFRIHYIQKMQFVPSVYVLVQTLVFATLFLLLFLKTEGMFEPALIFGFVAYMFIYALYLIDTLEQPFRKGTHSVDDVSIFLLRDFVKKIGGPGGETR